jgi:hypothetical protein
MTSDGKRIDYFRAMEERYYPPEMKTDDNGYRLIVRAVGANIKSERTRWNSQTGEQYTETINAEALRVQVYEKLGLDPNVEPTMKIESPWRIIGEYDKEYPPAEERETLSTKYMKHNSYWTFDDFPMFQGWLEENTAGLDLLAEAVRKPVFFIPYFRAHENVPIFESVTYIDAVQVFRDWARALQARANYRLGIGDIDGAIDDMVSLHRLGRHTGRLGFMLPWLVGIAIEGMGYSIGIGSNPDFPPTKEQITRLMTEFDTLLPRWTVGQALEAERFFGLAAFQEMYWGISPGGDMFPLSFPFSLIPAMSWTLDINIVMKRLNEMYDALLTGAEIHGTSLPIYDRGITLITALSGEEEKLRIKKSWNPLPLLFVQSRSLRIADTLCAMTLPGLQSAVYAEQRVECVENMQRLTLALLLYEKEHGKLPEDDWREAIKPYLGDDPDKYFQCPSHRLAEGETSYAMIGGVTNSSPLPNQILLVEIMQPQKLGVGDGRISLEEAKLWKGELVPTTIECCGRKIGSMRPAPRPDDCDWHGLGSFHVGGMNATHRSGAVRFISETIAPEILQQLLDGTATQLP